MERTLSLERLARIGLFRARSKSFRYVPTRFSGTLVSDKRNFLIARLSLPDHWCKKFFLAHCYLELLLNDSAMDIYFELQKSGLEESTYIMAQLAIAYHNKRELDQAVDSFKQLTNADPYRLDNLDTYSNVLYVKEQRLELAHLAHHTVQIGNVQL